jgi:hypothetical protein
VINTSLPELVADEPEGTAFKVDAKVVSHGRHVAFRVAQVAIPIRIDFSSSNS